MKTKFIAIWKIIKNRHFLLMTIGGEFVGVMPKDLEQAQLMHKLAKELTRAQNISEARGRKNE